MSSSGPNVKVKSKLGPEIGSVSNVFIILRAIRAYFIKPAEHKILRLVICKLTTNLLPKDDIIRTPQLSK